MSSKIHPKLKFNNVSTYDMMIHKWKGVEYVPGTHKVVGEYMHCLESEWSKVERLVFDTMGEVAGLEWQQPIIDCFVVKKTIAFSKPLTIGMGPDINRKIEVLIHELVHNILSQNINLIHFADYSEKYGKLNKIIRLHILVHAVLKDTLLKVYGQEQTNILIKKNYKSPDYLKAWEIVEAEGTRNIIRDCIKTN
ncbi:MAG: hypothetical protein K0B02_05455 [DPANN group archaeon]|nr:hypothetical protein [DPANN group archaeon]